MPEIDIVYTASSGSEAMRLANLQPFDLYLLDIELPDTNGFDLIEKILQKYPDARILINTMHEEIWTLKRLMKAPIRGAILKSADINELVTAIQTILEGETYVCKRFKEILNRIHAEEPLKEQLTMRERDVLQAIARGLNTREIAELFHVSNNTIESHRKSLMAKLEAKNAVDLVLKAIHLGIISLDNK